MTAISQNHSIVIEPFSNFFNDASDPLPDRISSKAKEIFKDRTRFAVGLVFTIGISGMLLSIYAERMDLLAVNLFTACSACFYYHLARLKKLS